MNTKTIMRSGLVAVMLFIYMMPAIAQKKSRLLEGMYIQWGYNTEWYTKSNIHFSMANGDKFTLHHAKAEDKPDLDAVLKKPAEISLSGFFLATLFCS